MNGFDAFWAALEAKGQAGEFHDPRILAMLAWDGALCAAQDRNRDAACKGKKPKNSRVQHPGIGADAAALGCHRMHLWSVLTKRRSSKSLIRRYRELQARKGGRES